MYSCLRSRSFVPLVVVWTPGVVRPAPPNVSQSNGRHSPGCRGELPGPSHMQGAVLFQAETHVQRNTGVQNILQVSQVIEIQHTRLQGQYSIEDLT